MKVKYFKHGKYFRLEEFLRSTTAQKLNIKLEPNAEQLENIENLIYFCLDPLRTYYGKAIIITSGFRNEELNKAVGGSANSQHMKGEAADIVPSVRTENNFNILFNLAKEVDFDQLILERKYDSHSCYVSTWIHISFKKSGNRRQVIENLKVGKFPARLMKDYPQKSYILPPFIHKTREEELKNEEDNYKKAKGGSKNNK